MAKKFFSKALSVGLSLTLCASLAAPAFAASFQDLNDAIKGSGGNYLGDGRYGYAYNEENKTFGIEAWNDGNDRNVQLNEDVVYGGEGDATTITVSTSRDVILNLNGNTIDGGYRAEETDEDGNITQEASNGSGNSVVTVGTNVTAKIENGTITGGNATNGGGIYAGYKSTVEIEDVNISGNTANNGGGINAATDTSVTIKDSDITGNTASVNSSNTGGGGGGIMASNANVTIENSVISNNTADKSGGGISAGNSTITVTDSVVANNSALVGGDDVVITNTTLSMSNASEMKDENGEQLTLGEDGKLITGWYYDMNGAWDGDGAHAYYKYDRVSGFWKGTGFLKAAHDQYFKVTNENGDELFNVENGTVVSIEDIAEPTLNGYNFLGWAVDGEPVEGTELTVNKDMILTARWEEVPTAEIPGGVDAGIDTGIEIDDPAIPLASGPVTRAEFVDYLWRHEGEPAPVADSGLFEDVTEEHELSPAMAWAKSVGIIEAYEDGTFEPDELVTVGAVRSILDNFARVFGTNVVAAADLVSLTGDEDEAVLNCDEVLAEFFGEDLAAAA